MKLINKFIEDPGILLSYLSGFIYKKIITYKKNISIKSNLIIIGMPIFDIRKNSKISIGDNVLLRSRNKGYHANILAPCKLMTDPDAFISIGDNTRIYGSCIHASKSIKIGSNCLIAANSTIIDRNGHSLSMDNPSNRINSFGESKSIVIEDNVWIGLNVVITPGVTIGEGSIIMSNSVVNTNIDKFSLNGGVPSIKLKDYNGDKK